jgi:osmotically-inducible protein OsmY
VVQLSGFAASQEEINKAVAIAQKTSGVKSVRNNVILRK